MTETSEDRSAKLLGIIDELENEVRSLIGDAENIAVDMRNRVLTKMEHLRRILRLAEEKSNRSVSSPSVVPGKLSTHNLTEA